MNTSLYGGIIEIGSDGHPITPELILAFRSGNKQGVIQNVAKFIFKNQLMNPKEISFDVYKKLDEKQCDLWDDIKDFKLIYIPHFDNAFFNPWFELSVSIDESDCTIKHCEAHHIQEMELSQLSLNEVEINTENDIAREDYLPTVIYDEKVPNASLIDRLLSDKATHYSIAHVDTSLSNLQRTFTFDNTTIKDAFDTIASEIECIFIYGESSIDDGKIHRTISLYDLNDYCLECGERGTFANACCPKCGSTNIKYGFGEDSGIFLSQENFADQITYSSNQDDTKNCFRLVAGDDLMTATIRNINPSGSQYIWFFSDAIKADMSEALQNKLQTYDELYNQYNSSTEINISSTAIANYNSLINKYKLFDNSFSTVSYPIMGYTGLTDLYYAALNLYGYLKTTLAPISQQGVFTTAANEIKKITSASLSPLGIQDATKASVTTVTTSLVNYAKVYIDTSLYRVSAENISYSNKIWNGTITLKSYSDENDSATTSLSIYVSDASTDYLKCQIEKAMKKNEVDATSTVELFGMDENRFKKSLSFYSLDNLNILANIARSCLDILITQGVADPSHSLYNTIYIPYYNKNEWIQEELREREIELLVLRGTKSNPIGILDMIENQRQIIANNLDLKSYLGETLWAEFCSFRRDDTYQNDNYISDGLSDEELIYYAEEFVKNAKKEIVKSATLQHTISCNLSNFLLVKEQDVSSSLEEIVTLNGVNIVSNDQLFLVRGEAIFSPLLINFEVGNWLHIEIDEKIYKLRLTQYVIEYDNIESLNVEFSDVTYTSEKATDIVGLISQTNSMATSYSMIKKQANKGNRANQQIVNMVENGLSLTNNRIVNSADNQNMVVDNSGLLMREKNEYGDDYSSEQIKIINHGFYYTNDNWRTVQTGLGKFIYYDPESGTYKEDYGLIAHKIVGNIILGNEVGIYNTSGSVKMDENGVTITADSNDTNKNLFTLQKKNSDGSYTKYVYVDDDGDIKINGKHIQITTSQDLETYIDNTIKQEAAALIVQLSNEYIGVSTDSNGDNGDFSYCYTDFMVFVGNEDITNTSDYSLTITASSGVIGEWNKLSSRYKVNNLTTNVGEILFEVDYNGIVATKILKVVKIKNGQQGVQGIPGNNGIDGTSNYVHIKYSNVPNPTDDLITEVPSTYIGICTDTNVNDPSTASSYVWSRFMGKDGEDGIPGTNGEDGLTTYVHFAYSTSADGQSNFSVTEFDGAIYLGVYTDTTLADSTNYRDYAWSKIKGDDGSSITIVSTEVAYIPSDDGINPPIAYYLATDDGRTIIDNNSEEFVSHTWLSSIPYVIEGSYLWTRTTVTYSDGTSTISYSVARQGIDGTNGADGTPGRDGIDGTSNYVHIKYSAYPNPTDTQISETPLDYIGICINTTLKDPTSANSYTWSKFQGKDGENGIPGADGYVHFAYANSADGSVDFSVTEFTGALYLGVYSDHTQADSTNYRDYAWSKIKGDTGEQGVQGIPGKSSYIHIKYSSVANPTNAQMTETPSAYIGIYVDENELDSDNASAYEWSKFQGKDGENGIPGADGYVHFAYANSADGSVDFSVTEFTGALYLGVYSDHTQADSTNYRDYAWSKIKGEDATITSTVIEYLATTEKTNIPPESIEIISSDGKFIVDNSENNFVTNKWTNTIPDLEDGMYLWTRTIVNYSDGNSTISYSNAKQGDVGESGRSYFLELDSSAVKIDSNNIIYPDKIIAKSYYRDGNTDRVAYPCRFVISKTYKNGLSDVVLSSQSNVSEQSFTIYGESDMPQYYTVEIHKAGQNPDESNLLDIQTIPILVDSANLSIGARNLIKNSDKVDGCYYYGSSGIYSITQEEIDSKRVTLIQSNSGSNSAKAVYYEVYTDNLLNLENGTKLTVSMNIYARMSTTISVCLANPNGVMQTTDLQSINLVPGWNKVYTVLTLDDVEFEIVDDSRNNILTSTNLLLTTGNVGLLSNVLRITDNMNSGSYYAIDYIQLEKGNRPTDYYPAPEDLINYVNTVTEGASDELKAIIVDILTQVITNREAFDDLLSEDGQIAEIRRNNVVTQQNVDSLQTDINTYIVQVDTIEGKIVDIEQTTECFSMEDAGLRITRKISGQTSDEQLSMLLSEQKLSFYQGNNEVAYFSNNKLYVINAEILENMQIGNFSFIPRSNGNLSFRYVGN